MVKKQFPSTLIAQLPTYDDPPGVVNVVIETLKGCRNKFKYDTASGVFKLGSVLPAGATFPFDFGFVPGTLGEDGDPLDVLMMMDEPAHVGCVVPARLIGVMEAEQTEDGKTERNDRLVAVAAESHDHRDLRSFKKVSPELIKEIEHFFTSYHQMKGNEFNAGGCFGPKRAKKLIEQGRRRFRQQNGPLPSTPHRSAHRAKRR